MVRVTRRRQNKNHYMIESRIRKANMDRFCRLGDDSQYSMSYLTDKDSLQLGGGGGLGPSTSYTNSHEK